MNYAILGFAIAFASPAYALSDLEQGFSGALKGCETWVLGRVDKVRQPFANGGEVQEACEG